jgi:hypothetical protein
MSYIVELTKICGFDLRHLSVWRLFNEMRLVLQINDENNIAEWKATIRELYFKVLPHITPNYKGQSKSSRISLTLLCGSPWVRTAWTECFVAVSTCKFCWGCAMQFEGSGATSGGQGQWFLHHDNAPSHTSLVQQFLSSPNHRTLRISLRVTSGCSLLRKWTSKGHVSLPCRTLNRMRLPNSGKFQKKPSAGASNNGRIYGTSVVCVWARIILWRWLGTRLRMPYHYSAIPPFRELCDCPSYVTLQRETNSKFKHWMWDFCKH